MTRYSLSLALFFAASVTAVHPDFSVVNIPYSAPSFGASAIFLPSALPLPSLHLSLALSLSRSFFHDPLVFSFDVRPMYEDSAQPFHPRDVCEHVETNIFNRPGLAGGSPLCKYGALSARARALSIEI